MSKPVFTVRSFLTLITLICVFIGVFVPGQQTTAAVGINRQLNYQAKLLSSLAVPVPDGVYAVKFSIYDAVSGGNRLWTAAGTTGVPLAVSVTVTSGLFTVQLGDVAAGQNPLDLDWNTDSLYLGVTIAADSEMTPRKRLTAVPYAFNSETLQGQYASSSVASTGGNLFALHQLSTNAASSDRTSLAIYTSGTSNLFDYLIKANSGSDVFTVSREGNVTTTGNLTTNGNLRVGDSTSDVATFTARIGSSLVPTTNNTYDLGTPSNSWANVYVSGTAFIGTDVVIGGSSVCLESGINCPASSGSSDWVYTATGDFLHTVTATTDIVLGSFASSTGAGAYFDLSGAQNGTSTFYFGNATNANIVLGGTSTTVGFMNSLFVLDGNDFFTSGNIGAASSVYTNGAFIAGSATYFGDGYINKTNGVLRLQAGGITMLSINANSVSSSGSFVPTTNNLYNLGTSTLSWADIYSSGTIYGVSQVLTGTSTAGSYSFTADAGAVTAMDYPCTSASPSEQLCSYDFDVNGIPFLSVYSRADGSGGLQTTSTAVRIFQPLLPSPTNSIDLGALGTNAFRNIYASSTIFAGGGVTSTGNINPSITNLYDIGDTNIAWRNIYASGTIYAGTDVKVGGRSVCLSTGVNCPASSSSVTSTLADVTSKGSFATTTLQLYGGFIAASSTVTSTFTVLDNATFGNSITNTLTPNSVFVTTTDAYQMVGLNDEYDSIYINGSNLYTSDVAGGNGYAFLDITDPAHVSTTFYGLIPGESFADPAAKVAVIGRYMFGVGSSYFRVTDISNKAAPVFVTTTVIADGAYNLLVNGNLAFVTGGQHITVVDISNPVAPKILTSYDTGTAVAGMQTQGSYLYYTLYTPVGGKDFFVLDYTSTTNLTLVGSAVAGGSAIGVGQAGKLEIQNNRAYVITSGTSTLSIVNISNPRNPVNESAFRFSVTANLASVEPQVAGDYAYVGSFASSSVEVINIASSTHPFKVATIVVPTGTLFFSSFAVHGNYIYAMMSNVLYIYKIPGITTTAIDAFIAQFGSVVIQNDAWVSGHLYVNDGLNVGAGGIQTDGSLGASGHGTSSISWALSVGSASTVGSSLTVTGTSTVLGDQLVGTSTYSAGLNSLFGMNGNDLFVQGNIGSASSVYTNGAFIAGPGSTYYGDGFINKTNGPLAIQVGGATILSINANSVTSSVDIIPSVNNLYSLGSPSKAWLNIYSSGTAQLGTVAASGRADLPYLNRWFTSPLLTQTIYMGGTARVPVDTSPESVAFDGTHIWSVNFGGGDISKVDVLTNSVVGTVTVGTQPVAAAFDGQYLWVTNRSDNSVSKVDVNSNTVVATVGVGASPWGIAFDGSFMWVANSGGSSVSKVNVHTNTTVATVAVGSAPRGVAYDGRGIWVANFSSNNLSKINITTNAVVATTTVGTNPKGVAFDGAHIWATNVTDGTVSKIDISTNAVVATTTVGAGPYDAAFDGQYIWVTNNSDVTISRIDIRTNAVVGTTDIASSPSGLAFDGSHMWAADGDSELVKIPIGGGNGSTEYFNVNMMLGGTSTTVDFLNSLFSMTGDDLFVSGNIGVASSVYTNASFIAGKTNPTSYNNGSIITAAGSANFVINPNGPGNGGNLELGDPSLSQTNVAQDSVIFDANIGSNILPRTDNTYALGTTSSRWLGYFSYVTSSGFFARPESSLKPVTSSTSFYSNGITSNDNSAFTIMASGSSAGLNDTLGYLKLQTLASSIKLDPNINGQGIIRLGNAGDKDYTLAAGDILPSSNDAFSIGTSSTGLWRGFFSSVTATHLDVFDQVNSSTSEGVGQFIKKFPIGGTAINSKAIAAVMTTNTAQDATVIPSTGDIAFSVSGGGQTAAGFFVNAITDTDVKDMHAAIIAIDETSSTRGAALLAGRKCGTALNGDIAVFSTDLDLRAVSIRCNGSIHANSALVVDGGDYAEMFPSADTTLMPGEVVAMDAGTASSVKRAMAADRSRTLGVISSDPTVIGNAGPDGARQSDPHYKTVALLGQLKVAVSDANGPIRAGDKLMAGDNGRAVRASGVGIILGQAMEDALSATGSIMTYVDPGWSADGVLEAVGSSTDILALGTADATTTAYDSSGLSFSGSVWDAASSTAISSTFTLQNDVISASSSLFTIRNGSGNSLLTISDVGDLSVTGDLTVGRRLYLGSKTTGAGSTSTYLFVDDTQAPTSTYIATNADGWSTATTYDYAERFHSSSTLESGDLVAADSAGKDLVRRVTSKNDVVLGIVSTKPGFITGAYASGTFPIALAGRVPTRVSTANGAILPGDQLAPSDVAGVAVKAIESGPIVGIALEAYDAPAEGKISVFVQPGWRGGQVVQTDASPAAITYQTTAAPAVSPRSGLAKIAAGATEVNVSFASLNSYPLVTVTPYGQTTKGWWLTNVNDHGFTITLGEAPTFDLVFAWKAEPSPDGSTMSLSDGTSIPYDPTSGQTVGIAEPALISTTSTPSSMSSETTTMILLPDSATTSSSSTTP